MRLNNIQQIILPHQLVSRIASLCDTIGIKHKARPLREECSILPIGEVGLITQWNVRIHFHETIVEYGWIMSGIAISHQFMLHVDFSHEGGDEQ